MSRRLLLLLLWASLVACGGSPASQLAVAPEYAPANQAKCGVAKDRARPLVVEWPSADRAALEAQTRRGVVVVRYVGCEMEVLRQCRAPVAYTYVPVTRQDDHLSIKDADALYASVPIHAAELESRLVRGGSLEVDMSMVGAYEADRAVVQRAELEGDCARATHVVTSLTAGAFALHADAGADVTARGAGLGATASGRSTSRRELLNRGGDADRCGAAAGSDTRPPDGCGALLRVEVAAIGAGPKPPACPGSTRWDGVRCAEPAAPRVVAPEAPRAGTPWHCSRAGKTWMGNFCFATQAECERQMDKGHSPCAPHLYAYCGMLKGKQARCSPSIEECEQEYDRCELRK